MIKRLIIQDINRNSSPQLLFHFEIIESKIKNADYLDVMKRQSLLLYNKYKSNY